jgi:hypothetical protein
LTAYGAYSKNSFGDVHFSVWALLGALCLLAIAALSCNSIYSLQPNESAVLTLFGSYFGTDSTPGLRAAFPLLRAKKVSRRVRYDVCGNLKVNDLIGNPIEIGGPPPKSFLAQGQGCSRNRNKRILASEAREEAILGVTWSWFLVSSCPAAWQTFQSIRSTH